MIVRATNKVAFEAAEYSSSLQSLVLLGTEALATYLSDVHERNLRSSEHSFVAVYGIDQHFYYKIERISNGVPCVYEVGVGTVTQSEGNIILERTHPILYKYKDEEPRLLLNQTPPPFFKDKDDIIIVSSYIPSSLAEALPSAHTIVTSSAPHCPQPVEIQENSLLGRLDGDVESLSIEKLPAVAPTFDSVRDAPEIKGSIIFDNEWNVLKYYNGKEWIQIG